MNYKLNLSSKGSQLLQLYKNMAQKGYLKKNGQFVGPDKAYNSFEIINYKELILDCFKKYSISSVLDYGSGASNWYEKNFHNQMSAIEYFNLKEVVTYEPAREKNLTKKLDCVVCFDVLEHIYINDLKNVINHIYENAQKLVVINIACFPAKALLPNGENAHITIRPPIWWKGYLDNISTDYPHINSLLLCREKPQEVKFFKIWNNLSYDKKKEFKIDIQ